MDRLRIPNDEHAARGWLTSQIAPDFRLLDVWALPVAGGCDEFVDFLELGRAIDPVHDAGSTLTRVLFGVRLWLGARLGWDAPEELRPIPGCAEVSLRERLPEHLRGSAVSTPVIGAAMRGVAGGFEPLFLTDNEWAAEIANATVHGVLQLTWVADGDGTWRGRMGVYVKPRGFKGEVYMRLIDPFRQLIVYPALMRQISRAWESRLQPTAP